MAELKCINPRYPDKPIDVCDVRGYDENVIRVCADLKADYTRINSSVHDSIASSVIAADYDFASDCRCDSAATLASNIVTTANGIRVDNGECVAVTRSTIGTTNRLGVCESVNGFTTGGFVTVHQSPLVASPAVLETTISIPSSIWNPLVSFETFKSRLINVSRNLKNAQPKLHFFDNNKKF